MSFALLSLGSFTQAHACPCADEETLTINQRYHEANLLVDQAVVARLQNPGLITLVKASITLHQSKIAELSAMSINAGIPYKASDISQGFTDRANQDLSVLKNTSGSALDDAYINFRASELQRLLTAFDTYFITAVTTPTMKAWVPGERALVSQNYNQAIQEQAQLMPQ